jgi:two-component system, NtrC family, sensor kinase
MIDFVRLKARVLSIKVKFTIAAFFISFVSFGIAAFFSTHWLAKEIEEDYKEKAKLMGTHIIHDIRTAMISRIHGGVSEVVDIYRKYKDVEEVRLFNPRGKEVFSQEQGPPEAEVEEALRTGTPIHFYKKINKQDVTTFIIPIKSGPECHGCHEKGEKLRGALLLSLSQAGMDKFIGQQRQKYFLLFGLIAIAIAVATIFAVNRLFLKPLKLIQNGAEAIEKGDFEYQISVKSSDEIGFLARNFNHMAKTLQTFIRYLEAKNRQLGEQYTLVSRSQKEWQETFDCITDPVAVIDHNGSIIRANKALKETFKEYFPDPKDEAAHNNNLSELFGNDICFDSQQPSHAQDRTPTTKEIHDKKTGKVFEVSLFPYYSHEGDFTGSVVILKDVTEKKEDEMRLIMNERLAAVGQMASGIAHEINTPLATISACNEGLLNRVEKENIGSLLFRSYLKTIEGEIERCKKITTGMLSFVRGTNHEKREIDVNEVLDKTLDMVSFQGRLKEVEVSRNSQRRMPRILGNDGELMQVCLAIVTNALDAMENKGTLTLETGIISRVPPHPCLPPPRGEGWVGDLTKGGTGGFVFVKISDTGPGIPSGLIDRIFDPFFTTKSEKGGTGLGLSIANKIIRDYNGKIDVASKEGKGTTFEIVLPISNVPSITK